MPELPWRSCHFFLHKLLFDSVFVNLSLYFCLCYWKSPKIIFSLLHSLALGCMQEGDTSDLIPAIWFLLHATNYLIPAIWFLLPDNSDMIPAFWFLLPDTSYLILVTCYMLLGYFYMLLVTRYLLPAITSYMIHITWYLLPNIWYQFSA